MKIDKNTTLHEFVTILPFAKQPDELVKDLFERCGKKYTQSPFESVKNLNEISFDELVRLLTITNVEDEIFNPFKVLMNKKREEVLKYKVFEVFGFIAFIKTELEKIAKLWSKTNKPPTTEEVQAGIKNIDHGWFGIADWYAKRMHITNHDEVYQTKWIRIYQCYKNDFETEQFNQRYREILTAKRKI